MFYDVMLVEFLSAVRIGNVDALRNFVRYARCLQVRGSHKMGSAWSPISAIAYAMSDASSMRHSLPSFLRVM